ncbi:MAG: gamma-glutamylcyclotransferase family protein [Thermodesulfobacteriota bacterium]
MVLVVRGKKESVSMVYYFAYGSNLHPMRLIERVPSAELVSIAEHSVHKLTFHKKSNDGSSKCNIFKTGKESDLIYGAIYRLNPGHKNDLDRFESKGYGYIDTQITVQGNENMYSCFTYIAQESHITNNLKPYHWYKRLVILGAQYLNFPDSYISSIEAVESVEDSDINRRKEKEVLIEKVIKYR